MPEYVYALHDFRPENEDEVSFNAGERIEVIEKDDMYGDGWWQGRNLAAEVGLFPVSYTAPAPPVTATSHVLSPEPASESHGVSSSASKSILQPLTEESEINVPAINILSPVPKHPTSSLLNNDFNTEHPHEGDASHNRASGNNEMMKATMTDVQKAIEQLGRNDVDARSFSFASTRDGENTENSDTDFDLSDFDGSEMNGNDGEDWHKGARRKLAAKAKRAVEEAKKLEEMMGDNENGKRTIAPPIEADFSDESEAEDNDDEDLTRSTNFHRNHPHIPEEDENVLTDGEATSGTRYSASPDVLVPPNDETDIPTATKPSFSASQSPVPNPSFSASQSPIPTESLPVEPVEKAPTIEKDIYPSPISPPTTTLPNIQQILKRSSTPAREISNGLPSPASFGHIGSKHNSMISSSSAPGTLVNALQVQQQQQLNGTSVFTRPTSIVVSTTVQARKETPPMEWNVDDVVNWLKSKGFDQDVCDKFTEQEITGDVLLELDVNLLKSEIGVMAFGKRMRIANAIADLRRPPSVQYSDHSSPSQHQSNSPSQSHSRTESQSLFPVTTPATTVGQVHSYGIQNSLGSPGPVYGSQQSGHRRDSIQNSLGSPGPVYGNQQSGHRRDSVQNSLGSPGSGYASQQSSHLQDSPVNINGDMKAADPVGMESGTATGVAAGMSAAAGVGLGIALSPMNDSSEKGPPSRLFLSSSNAALKESAVKTVAVNGDDEDRGHMSDGDITLSSNSIRRRIFGLSHESAASIMNSSSRSKGSPLSSPIVLDNDVDSVKEKALSEKDSPIGVRHARSRKSGDSKPGDRLSIFGATFGGTLGKSRKPPPSEDALTERTSKFGLPRLHSSSIQKSSSVSSHRPSTSAGSPQKSPSDFSGTYVYEEKEREKSFNTLRKRNSNPVPNVPTTNTSETENGVSGTVRQGWNIMDQIGEPDHTGWMRKRGERFNSWKNRYFILKGPHLYFLRSNNKSETRLKGYIHIIGYKVTVDETVDPGRYGFRIDHDRDETHYFSSEEKTVIRDWMKAIMKATILRDYAKPVVSSCNIPTIPLMVAQAMNPAPRPPSPSARAATQRALRRDNTEQLTTRDTRVLGINIMDSDFRDERTLTQMDSYFSKAAIPEGDSNPSSPQANAPPRPSRQLGRMNSARTITMSQQDNSLIVWANTHLPESLQINESTGYICSGLELLRLAESIKGQASSPPVPSSAFPADMHDDKLDGLFRLFDFLLDNDVKMGSVSINDVRLGKRDKIIQLLKALKAWEDKRKAIAFTMAKGNLA